MEFDEQLYLKYACVAYMRSKHRSEKPAGGGSTPPPGTNGASHTPYTRYMVTYDIKLLG